MYLLFLIIISIPNAIVTVSEFLLTKKCLSWRNWFRATVTAASLHFLQGMRHYLNVKGTLRLVLRCHLAAWYSMSPFKLPQGPQMRIILGLCDPLNTQLEPIVL